jgi:hypothetical protein
MERRKQPHQSSLGTYVPPADIDVYARSLLEALQTPEILIQQGPVTVELLLEEHTQGWKRQKEAMASEPTGLSFSHYKAASQDGMISEVDRFLRNLPYQKGFSPEAWQFITDVEV